LGEQIKALEDFNKSLELEPDYLKSLLRRAEISMKREDYSAALNDFVRAQ
jgi:Tfp pilus assembly protein PilF